MTTRPNRLLHAFALTLATLAVFACSPSAEKGEMPPAAEAPAAGAGTEPEAGEGRFICGLPAGFGLEAFDKDIDPDAPAIAFLLIRPAETQRMRSRFPSLCHIRVRTVQLPTSL